MSRRKQGRPVQRLTIDSVEQENDLLVCGDCQTNFRLREITKFIRHKVNKCGKEKTDENESYEQNDDGNNSAVISSKRTPISAPITRRELLDAACKLSCGANGDVKIETEDEAGHEVKDVKERVPLKQKQGVDAESNTTNTEPVKVTCDSCRKVFGSAWLLMQHAQKDHGLRIYVTSSRDSHTPSESHRSTPNAPRSRKGEEKSRESDHRFDDKRDKNDSLHKFRNDLTEPLRTTPSVGSVSSGEGPHSRHAPSPHNPFMYPRMPFGDIRHPLSPITGLGHFGRDLRLDFPQDVFAPRGLFGLPSFEHGTPSASPYHPFEPRRGGTGMSLDDFYSQRLRQLASSTSPLPPRKHTPPFPQSPLGGSSTSPASMFNHSHGGKGSTTPTELDKQDDTQGSPGNQKSCEFCGKTFRFQSNLIVHRRSHTGEKPYKCPLCPHACTQQSKLKRHLKTHSKTGTANTSEGSHPSSSSTPDSNKMGDDDDDDADEEEEEEQEEEEEEEMEINSIKQEPGYQNKETDQRKCDEQRKAYTSGSELAARLFNERIAMTITSELAKDDPASKNVSILTEVIQNSGLQNLPQYNDAFKQAMAEKGFLHAPIRPSSNPPPAGSPLVDKLNALEDKEQQGCKRERPAEDSNIMSISKMIKKEPHEKQNHSPVPTSQRLNNIDPPFWFQNHHDNFFKNFHLSDITPNGFGGISSGNESSNPSSSVLNSMNATSTPIPTNGSPAVRKDRLRNDTCEFCGKVFKNCSNLTVHRRSHTGEKPYKCMLCSYACAQSSKLTRHMKTHGRYGKDVYKCKFCMMPFSVPSTLEKHMRKCVENLNKMPLGDGEDSSNSDEESASDSQSALSSASLSLPSTPLNAPSLNIPMTFSLAGTFDKHMRRAESSNAMDGDDTGSNSDATPVSEASVSSASMLPLSYPSPALSLASSLALASSGLSLGIVPSLNAQSPNI
ncbi:B-cell lymphoma/leukemia 11A-like isoform X2 [Dreissena polymorpha]|uniref:B-cell lymphoma/leukemia 11A-like isoform X2 n=1 Tax=Dreissena polymorpha TaxID=45954 RepID=UPI002264E6C4|nr:B-cell lymphoma/leukemia 11A-like isoform X2 [Dreissena polymorpha]